MKKKHIKRIVNEWLIDAINIAEQYKMADRVNDHTLYQGMISGYRDVLRLLEADDEEA